MTLPDSSDLNVTDLVKEHLQSQIIRRTFGEFAAETEKGAAGTGTGAEDSYSLKYH